MQDVVYPTQDILRNDIIITDLESEFNLFRQDKECRLNSPLQRYCNSRSSVGNIKLTCPHYAMFQWLQATKMRHKNSSKSKLLGN